MSPFKEKVIEIVRLVPYGTVVSYGQVAVYAGLPRAARQVGWALNSLEDTTTLPWWRVINNAGRISIKGTKTNGPLEQKRLLQQEGVSVSDKLEIPIEKYRFLPDETFLLKLQLPTDYIELVLNRYRLTQI